MEVYSAHLHTPLGFLEFTAIKGFLTATRFLFEDPPQPGPSLPVLEEAKTQCKAYFGGRLQQFDLPLQLEGTDFQKRVWHQLSLIPFGHTLSYGSLAARLGDPAYVRAVGAANGKNPVGLIVPCHRVIGAAGQLVGYAGGIARKKWLLRFEAEQRSAQTRLF